MHILRMKFMFTSLFLVLLMPIFFSGCLCLGSDTILRGQYLFPNQTIISKGRKFELGFFTTGNSSNYYVGIWYKNIPAQTVVWVANRNSPFSHSWYNDSGLQLSKNGNLQLTVFLKRFEILVYSNATEAVILDTGNFVLRNGSGTIIWQSFDHPTNTWLPGGKIGFQSISNTESKLVSWKNRYNPATGDDSLVMAEGNQLFMWRNDSRIFTSLRFSDTSSLNSYNYTYIQVGGSAYFVYNVFDESMISRIVIDSIGRLTHFVWSEDTQAWDVLWVKPSDACIRYALCGANAICDINATPACSCLTGFVPRAVSDWDSFNFSAGCVREYRLLCNDTGFTKVSNIKLPANHTKVSNSNLPANLENGGFNKCESVCAQNCSCNAYGYNSNGGCLLYMGDLLGLELLPSNSYAARDLYVRTDTFPALQKSRRKGNLDVPRLALVVPSSILFVVCSITFCYYWRRRKSEESQPGGNLAHQNLLLLNLDSNGPEKDKRLADGTNGPGDEKNIEYELPTFSFSSIAAATNDFSIANKLGEGGFGPVYKGELLNGQFVAVKRLSKRSGQGLEEFKNETELIAKLQHRNLVGILGCCIENDEKILVYEFMLNKSLDFFLFDPNKKELLDWGRRVQIIEGIAQGLLYLHHYSRLRIVHRDLKASNILLDAEMNPKISDFGMARIFGGTDLQANTRRIVGTYGYMSPEYAMDGVFSIKSDVFAFGVLMLEIISGKRNTGFYASEHLSLLGYAWNLWTNNRGLELVDPSLEMLSSSSSIPLRYIQVGLLCVQENPGDRPMMSDVVAMLSKEQIPVASPQHPAFFLGRTLVHNTNPGDNKVENCSVNDMTLSLMEAR